MIKNFSIIILILSVMSCQQEGVQFKNKIKPNKKYTKHLSISSISEVNFIADQETLDLIESQGYKLPINIEIASEMTTEIITGDRVNNGEIIAAKNYGEMSAYTIINGDKKIEKSPYSGTKVLGRYDKRNKLLIDSIIGQRLTPQMRYFHTETLGGIEKKIIFPQNIVKVGDTIENETPLNIPIQGMDPVKAIIKTNYILKEIRGNKAFLEFAQAVSLDAIWGQDNINLTGVGKGDSQYNIDENQLIKYASELPMELTIKINEKMTAKIKITMYHDQDVTID